MKMEEVASNAINPPSALKTIKITKQEIERLPSTEIIKNEKIDKFLEVFSKESQKAIESLAVRINEFARNNRFSLKFIPEKEKGMVIIKIFDGEGNLVRQIPPEEILALSAELTKQKGFLLNLKI